MLWWLVKSTNNRIIINQNIINVLVKVKGTYLIKKEIVIMYIYYYCGSL